jgi:hypothetical protein
MIAYRTKGPIARTPLGGKVPKEDLDGKVDEDGEGEILPAEPELQELQSGDGLVGDEADLGDEEDKDELAEMGELHEVEHGLIGLLNGEGSLSIIILGFLALLGGGMREKYEMPG